MNNEKNTLVYRREGDYIYFGEYPQSLKRAEVEVGDDRDGRGYYLGSDGQGYARVIAAPKGQGYTFGTGEPVTAGNEYFFLVEPLCWRVLKEAEGRALLVCDRIIENMAYQSECRGDLCVAEGVPEGIYANNYRHSGLRRWLHGGLLPTAFSEAEAQAIMATEVDNSSAVTALTSNGYTCENTLDRLFLLSYRDLMSEEYGLSSGKLGPGAVSDYARATGAFMSTVGATAGTGFRWTRTPAERGGAYALVVTNSAAYSKTAVYVYSENIGVAPALWIKL